MVADPRARMSKFVSSSSNLVVKECLTAMLIKEMDVSRLKVHAQQIEEEKLKEKTKDSKRARRDDGEFSHSRFDGSDHSQGKGGSEKCGPSAGSVGEDIRVLTGSNACFGCGNTDHKIRNCPMVARNEGDNRQWTPPYHSSGPNGGRKQDRFYVSHTQEDHEVPQMW
ncbi:uncharacterized protein LOC125829401 [Solanum verrucosum]|uniref:uncharacterized protein LOC125829401 n=1 Tax=Solanum verrucosum TaxID=315347 RepID=UPI0020D08C30|nr:uncharacterized protein LOC125829401 [Solanum verrucosum]